MNSQDQGWRQANFTDQPLTIEEIVAVAFAIIVLIGCMSW